MHNFGTVLRFEISRTIKKPTFWLSVLSVPIVAAIIFAVVYFSSTTRQERDAKVENDPFSLIIQDESKLIPNAALQQFKAERVTDKQAGIDQVRQGKVEAFFYYPPNVGEAKVEIYNENAGLLDNGKYDTVAKLLLSTSAGAQVKSPQIVSILQDKVATTQTNFEDGEQVNPLGRLIPPIFLLVVFYAIILVLGGQMLTSTTEEKENRVTEMLLTSISSRTLIVGKIIALIILGFIQISVMVIPIVIAYFVAREALNIPDLSSFLTGIQIDFWSTLLSVGVLVSSFLLFTGILVGIGAATPTAKEANSFFGLVITIMMVPFWFFSLLMTPTDSVVVQGITYFPLTAPFALLIRNAFGVLPTHEGIIGLIIVTVAGLIAISLAVRIFRYGTLEYSKRLSLSTIFKRK